MKKDQNILLNETNTEDKIDFVSKSNALKIVAISLLSILGFLLIITIILKLSINPNNFKNNLNDEISKIILKNSTDAQDNAGIMFNEKVRFKVFPLPHILFNDVVGRNLSQNNYELNFNIKKAKLYISIKNMFIGRIKVKKVEILDSNFTLSNSSKEQKSKILKQMFEEYLSTNGSLTIISKQNNIIINLIDSKRELTDINVNLLLTQKKLNILGELKSNKQPLNIDCDLKKSRKGIVDGSLKLSSLIFEGNVDIEGDTTKNQFSGNAKFNIDDLQIFSRTMFSQTSFLYNRIIDNGNLRFNSSFSLDNNILEISELKMTGKNINTNGTMKFHFDENQKNEVNLNINNINMDNLITKNLGSSKKLNGEEVTIFNTGDQINQSNNEYQSFLDKKFSLNPTLFNIQITQILLNNKKLENSIINMSYLPDKTFDFTNVKFELPGSTSLTIIEEKNRDRLTISGKNLDEFISFARGVEYIPNIEQDKANKEFMFNGDLIFKNDRLFIGNSILKSQNLNSQNQIEIKFDSGIKFIAIKTKTDNLNLNNIINSSPKRPQLNNTLKNKILFINGFGINIYVNLIANTLNYKDLTIPNCDLTIRTGQGILSFDKINLNDKVTGKVNFNILNKSPLMNINLELNNLNYDGDINLAELIFKIPSLDDFYGNLILSGNNITFKKQIIKNFNLTSKISGGIINITSFNTEGFGGKCTISGFANMQFARKLNLTLNACTANIKSILEPSTGISNIDGLVGFSAILYGSGQTLNLFNKSWILKTQLIGSKIKIDNYGLTQLNTDLFNIQMDTRLLNSIKPEKILFNQNNQTTFETLSGTLQHTAQGGVFDFNINRSFINGKLVGNFNFIKDGINIDMDANFILLSGTLKKTIPLTILSKILGDTPNNIKIVTNFKQVDDYIKSLKDLNKKKKR